MTSYELNTDWHITTGGPCPCCGQKEGSRCKCPLGWFDSRPISEAFLRECGFATGNPMKSRLYYDDESVSIWNGKQHAESAIATVPRQGLTRGKLRRLLSVLKGGE